GDCRVGTSGLDRCADCVGLELEQQRLVREAAVDAQLADLDRTAHRLDHVGHTPGDCVERRTRDLRLGGTAVHAGDYQTRIGPPPRGPDAGEGRQYPYATRILGLTRKG